MPSPSAVDLVADRASYSIAAVGELVRRGARAFGGLIDSARTSISDSQQPPAAHYWYTHDGGESTPTVEESAGQQPNARARGSFLEAVGYRAEDIL